MNYDRCEDDGFIIRRRAISKLELMRCNSEWNEDFNKALDLAIKVLRQMGSEDLISRQQAIDAIEDVDWYHVNSKGELVSGSTSDEESWYKAEDIYEAIESLPPVTPTEGTGVWIPVSERLPKDLEEVVVTWVNRNPPVYYRHEKDKPQTGFAVLYRDTWHWWDSTIVDVLAEYGSRCEIEHISEDIEIIAWQPLPESYRPEGEDK